jgi:hypothetical protein
MHRTLGAALVSWTLLCACSTENTGGGNGAPSGPGSGTATLSLVFTGAGSGEAVSTPKGLDCRSSCSATFPLGTAVALSITADAASRFAGYGGACSGMTCTVTLSGNTTVFVDFEQGQGSTGGKVTLKVTFDGTGTGRVTSNPPGLDCRGDCSAVFDSGTPITLQATPDSGARFSGFGGACSGTACAFLLSSDASVFVDFETNAPSACSGIGFGTLPTPQVYATNPGFGRATVCEASATDASGALGFTVSRAAMQGSYFAVVGPDGRFRGSRSDPVLDLHYLPQPDGFTGTVVNPAQSVWATHHIAGDGTMGQTGPTYFGPMPWLAADPGGGIFVAGPMAGTSRDAQQSQIVSQDEGASVRGSSQLATAGSVFGLGADLAGNALVIGDGTGRFGGGVISAQWFDRFARALTGEFVLLTSFQPGRSTWFETAPLIGGGLAVRRMDAVDDGNGRFHATSHWLVTVPSGSATPSPAPDWLASRTDTLLAIVRGGRAYAFMPEAQNDGDCSQRVEVLTPDGQSCGAQDFRLASGNCQTLGIRIGLDGSVVQQMSPAFEQGAGTDNPSCSWRFWPALLR